MRAVQWPYDEREQERVKQNRLAPMAVCLPQAAGTAGRSSVECSHRMPHALPLVEA
jgi:hypothetical protein